MNTISHKRTPPENEPHRIDTLFAARARDVALPMWPTVESDSPLIAFDYGLADPTCFPAADLATAATAALSGDIDAALNYGPSYQGLQDIIIARLRSQGIEAEDEQVLISYGSSQALGLLPQVFVDPGDVVIIEGPTFMGAVRYFADAGARLLSVPLDQHGMHVDALEDTLADLRQRHIRPKFIYTIPTFHNPTGATMSLERRQRLVELSAERGVLIVEDDAYGDLRFEGQPLPHLAALDHEGWVIRLSTFSKILAPGVRLGWVYAHPDIIARLTKFKLEGSSGPFLTRMIAHYCEEGRLDAHIEELIARYRLKRDTMLNALAQHMPPNVTVYRPEGGFFVWCELPPEISAAALLERSVQHGASFLIGTRCFANGQGENAFRLAFSYVSIKQIEEGVARIGAALRTLMQP